MAEMNELETVPDLAEVVQEIDTHSRRIQAALRDKLALANTPDEVLAVTKELAAEMFETLIPLWADFSKASAMEIDDLNDEVFGVKLSGAVAGELRGMLSDYQALSVGNPPLVERIQNVLDDLEGDVDEEDEDDGEEDDEEPEPN